MDDSQGKKRQRKDKKAVDLDNLKREVEMVSIPTIYVSLLITNTTTHPKRSRAGWPLSVVTKL